MQTTVLRDGRSQEIPFENIVPGDIVMIKSGQNIPADCVIIELKDLFVNEATLTGGLSCREISENIAKRNST